MTQAFFRSTCAFAKHHSGFASLFIHSVVSNDSLSGQWRPWSDCADAQADLYLRCSHLPEETFTNGAAPNSLLPANDQLDNYSSRFQRQQVTYLLKHNFSNKTRHYSASKVLVYGKLIKLLVWKPERTNYSRKKRTTVPSELFFFVCFSELDLYGLVNTVTCK